MDFYFSRFHEVNEEKIRFRELNKEKKLSSFQNFKFFFNTEIFLVELYAFGTRVFALNEEISLLP